MRRFPAVFAVLLALAALDARPAAASNKLIAVLPLDVSHAKQKLDADAQASLEEMLRDVATDALASQGWTVLATQNMLQTLRDNGVDPTKCGEEACQVDTARELKAAKFISGAVQYVEGEFTASIRLIDTETGRILTSARLEGDSVKALRKAFEARASDFFAQGQMIAGTPAGATPSATQPAPVVSSSGPVVKKSKVTDAVGTLTVTAKPREAVRLEIEDPEGRKTTSGAPFENKLAKPGTWKITARASGYGDEVQSVVVYPDDVTLVKFDLKTLGGLAIKGTPEGAAVAVSGPEGFHDEGGIPWEASGLRAGTYSVNVNRQGYAPAEETVEVKPGETATVNITLQKAAVAAVSAPEGGEAPKPAQPSEHKYSVGLSAGALAVTSFVLPRFGAMMEYRAFKPVSYFADFSLTAPNSVAAIGFAYSFGIRWYIWDGLTLGGVWDGWAGKIGNSAVSLSGSIYAVAAEVGYAYSLGERFWVAAHVRVGYALGANFGGVDAFSSDTSSSASRVAWGTIASGGVRF